MHSSERTPREPVNLNEIEKSRTITSDRVEELFINASSANVHVTTAETDNFTINYTEHDFLRYQFIHEDNRFTVNQTQRFNTLVNSMNLVYTIEIIAPKNQEFYLNIRTSNGYITVENFQANGMELVTSNNPITITDTINTYATRLRTTNAAVNVTNFDTTVLNLTTSNNPVTLINTKAERIHVRNVNAPVTIRDIEATDISLITSNFPVTGTIIGFYDRFNKDIVTSNGTISIDNKAFGTILNTGNDQTQPLVVYTTHANISINFREPVLSPTTDED